MSQQLNISMQSTWATIKSWAKSQCLSEFKVAAELLFKRPPNVCVGTRLFLLPLQRVTTVASVPC